MKTHQQTTFKILWLILAIFFLWMSYQIPYTHDDWDWGNSIGFTQLVYATVNSRYVGNFLVVILTRSEFIKTLVMGMFFFLMPVYALYVSTGKRLEVKTQNVVMLLLSYVLFTGFPLDIWQQTNGWVSGFANYSFSAVILAIFVKQCADLFKEKIELKTRLGRMALYFFTSFVLQLFLENITVYVVAVAFCVFIARWMYGKKPSLNALAILLGAILGAILMFSSNIYDSLINTGYAVGDYRALTVDLNGDLFRLVYQTIYNFIAVILTDLYKGYWEYCLLLILILSLLGFKTRACTPKALFLLVQAVNILFIIYFAGQTVNIDEWLSRGDTRYMAMLRLLSSVGFFGLVAVQLFMYEKDIKKAGFAAMLWLSVPGVMLPLAVVNTVGPRSFFTSLFFIVMVTLLVADKLLEHTSTKWLKIAGGVSAAVFLLICLRLGTAYYEIGQVKNQRDLLIEQAKSEGLDEIIFPDYKNKDYLWLPNSSGYLSSFKEFYDIDASVHISIDE